MPSDNVTPEQAPCEAEEREHLDEVLREADIAYAAAAALANNTGDSYEEVARYLVDVRGEMDGHEMKLNKLELIRMARQAELAGQSMERVAKIRQSPYFARIDFLDEGEAAAQPTYIGRFAFNWDGRPIVSDWRSPVAGLFYDFDLGPAWFETPSGTRTGALQLKRQFRIEDGQMVYALDSDSAAQDEVLARELSRATETRMRTIIASIQREQNVLIRDEAGGTLVIQGVAGSGKTSIALHHIAYLLYRQRDTLSARNVAIISPTRVFSDYIGTVLPELGEEPVQQWSMHELAASLLKGIADVELPPRKRPADDPARLERMRIKADLRFADDMLAFIDGWLSAEHADEAFVPEDIQLGSSRFDGAWLCDRFRSYAPIPVSERLELMAESMLHEAKAIPDAPGVAELPTQKQLQKRLAKMLSASNPLALYKLFLKQSCHSKSFKAPAKGAVEWEDAFPIALCMLAFEEANALPQVSLIRHLVIDEMQDLTYVQHAAIARLFPGDKTILGDVNQLVDGRESVEAEAVQRLYPDSRFFALMRSYRSTHEINTLAQHVKPVSGLESVERHGAEPEVIQCGDTRGTLEAIDRALGEFEESDHRSCGIICKNDKLAALYAELIGVNHDISLITDETSEFKGGIVVTSVRLAKGLEFDEAILLDVDSAQYATPADRNLLYVAITRAMHKLTILYRVEPSPFLP